MTQSIQKIKQLLRNVAEVDPNDVIANAASQLAVDLEQYGRIQQLTETETQLIEYARSKQNQYVLYPDQKHAVNLQRVLHG